jgi:hypothetical protein
MARIRRSAPPDSPAVSVRRPVGAQVVRLAASSPARTSRALSHRGPARGGRRTRSSRRQVARPIPRQWCAAVWCGVRLVPSATGRPSRRRVGALPDHVRGPSIRRTGGNPGGGSEHRAGDRRRVPSPRQGRTSRSTGRAASGRAEHPSSRARSRSTPSIASERCAVAGPDRAVSRGCPSAGRGRGRKRSHRSAAPCSAAA